MASVVVQSVPILVGGIQVAIATDGSYDIDPGLSDGLADAGQYFNQTHTRCRASVSTIIPIADLRGNVQTMMDQIINKKDVEIKLQVGTKNHTFVGRFMSAGVKWSWSNGTMTGDFQFLGSEPSLG